MRLSVGFALVALATVVLAPPALGSKPRQAVGDIEPLLSETEAQVWARLGDETSRRTFREAFWQRLDPTPGTEDNELREIWERRVGRADAHYADAGAAGHATDRGRVLAVLGLPDEIEARSPDGGPAPREIWTYSAGTFQGPVRFVRDGDGYRLETEVPLSADAFVRSAREELRMVLAARFGNPDETPVRAPTLATRGDDADTADATEGAATAATAAALAPEVRIWMQLVLGGVGRDDLELRSDLDAFPAADGTYTTLAFELDADGLSFAVPTPEELAAAEAEEDAEGDGEGDDEETEEGDDQQEEAVVGEEAAAEIAASIERDAAAGIEPEDLEPVARLRVFGAFLQGEPGSENTIHQFIVPTTVAEDDVADGYTPLLTLGVTLAPGSYRLAWGVMDEATERVVTRDQTVEIPDFSEAGLRMTEPLLAVPPHIEVAEAMSTQAVYRGVRLGNVLVRDRLDRTFPRDGVVEVVTVVTGWESDPNQPGKPLLEVEYRILEGDAGVSLARIPVQSLDFHVLGQQIPLSQVARIEAGHDYRILIRVKDLVSGAEVERLAPFRVVAPATPSAERQ